MLDRDKTVSRFRHPTDWYSQIRALDLCNVGVAFQKSKWSVSFNQCRDTHFAAGCFKMCPSSIANLSCSFLCLSTKCENISFSFLALVYSSVPIWTISTPLWCSSHPVTGFTWKGSMLCLNKYMQWKYLHTKRQKFSLYKLLLYKHITYTKAEAATRIYNIS